MNPTPLTTYRNSKRLIVSLTTVDFRIEYIEPVVRSIIEQDCRADTIRLYISQEPYLHDRGIAPSSIPAFLKRWQKKGELEISYTQNTGPYRKLLPCLRENFEQNCLIVTADDDTIYPRDWLQQLYAKSLQHASVVGTAGHSMRRSNGKYLPYQSWSEPDNSRPEANFAIGKDGVLYAPEFFDEMAFSDDFLLVCPLADDVWFKFLTLRTGTGTHLLRGTHKLFPTVKNPDRKSLYQINHRMNDPQIERAAKYFGNLE